MTVRDDYATEHQLAQRSTNLGEASGWAPPDPRPESDLNGRLGVDSPTSTVDECAA
jgi:hypothetical protein